MKKLVLLFSVFCSAAAFAQIIYPGTPTVGTVETVYDYSVSKCNTIDIPDAPARAFRDASGKINLIASHYTSWRMTGASFTSLTKDCDTIMGSHNDSDPSKFNDREWIVSTYTTDGINIHALVHDEYVPCGNANTCWYNAITYVSSSDSGKTFTHTTAPSQLVAASPYQSPYPTTHAPFGIFGGSNIIKMGTYYYKMVQLENHLLQNWGAGLIRTNNLSDPTSWRGWDGTGFNVQFVNPYTQSGYDPADKVLAPVSRDNIAKMCASITYNTYFGKYMVVDYTNAVVNGSTVYGFYYALSDDLINWSKPRLIMQTTSSWAVGGSLYASIIDHNDTTRNFEQAGQNCYLYYTKWNSGTYDRDLLRVPVTFNKEIVPSLVVNATTDASDKTPGDGKCLTTGNVCTLRAALEEANARPPYDGYDTLALPITFNISGNGVKTISPATLLPDVMYPVAINGYTQAGASMNSSAFNQGMNTAITVAVDADPNGSAIAFHNGNNVVKGLSFINGSIDFLYEEGYSKGKNHNTVSGCYIGMSANGTTPQASYININNQDYNTIGGTADSARNLVGGGIIITHANYNTIAGNYIGTTNAGDVTSGTTANGIEINDSSAYNTIGGSNGVSRNLISGANRGIVISGAQNHNNAIMKNYIGVANDGISPLGNVNSGILLSSATNNNTISGNIIANNSYDEAGIWLDSTNSNIIQSNYIGTDSTETVMIGNGGAGTFSAGIMLLNSSANNLIGGTSASLGNVIANNSGFGIEFYTNAGNGNSIFSNKIYDNAEMGIDLSSDYTPDVNDNGDADLGPNGSQNYPVLSGAYSNSTAVSIQGTLNSTSNSTFIIQFFSNTACDPSGNGEGKIFIGTDTVTTNGSGTATINSQFNLAVSAGSYITSLATNSTNSTSEFSSCVAVASINAPTIAHNTALTFCEGGSVVLSTASANSYLWSNGATTQSVTIDSAGSYTVTIDTVGLTSASTATTVIVNPSPNMSISGTTTICNGGATTLTASGGDTFVWSNGPSTATYTVHPSADTTYIVTGTITATGCHDTVSQHITVETCTGITNTSTQEIKVYPNPSSNGIFTLSVKNSTAKQLNIYITNVLGEKVYQSSEAIAADVSKSINISSFAKGIYSIKLELDAEVLVKQVMIE